MSDRFTPIAGLPEVKYAIRAIVQSCGAKIYGHSPRGFCSASVCLGDLPLGRARVVRGSGEVEIEASGRVDQVFGPDKAQQVYASCSLNGGMLSVRCKGTSEPDPKYILELPRVEAAADGVVVLRNTGKRAARVRITAQLTLNVAENVTPRSGSVHVGMSAQEVPFERAGGFAKLVARAGECKFLNCNARHVHVDFNPKPFGVRESPVSDGVVTVPPKSTLHLGLGSTRVWVSGHTWGRAAPRFDISVSNAFRVEPAPGLEIGTFQLMERAAATRGEDPRSAREVALAKLSARSANAERGTFHFLGTLILNGSPGERVTAAALEAVRDGKVIATFELSDLARRRLLRPFGPSGRLALRPTSGRSPELFETDFATLTRLCVAPPRAAPTGRSKSLVRLRLRVSTASGTEATTETDEIPVLLCMEAALHGFEEAAAGFALHAFDDTTFRVRYQRKIRALSELMLRDVAAGKVTPEVGAYVANQLRNATMEETRRVTSPPGRIISGVIKKDGLTADAVIKKLLKDEFGSKEFHELKRDDRRRLFQLMIQKAGKSNRTITRILPYWRAAASACVLYTMGVSIFTVWAAKNKVRALLREAAIISGAATGARLGALAGIPFGPAAPFVGTGFFVVGGIIGALVAEMAVDQGLKTELADWLGEE